ncbi:MAG: bifunctional phosphoglucose/phosphomannose isomerase [Ignavibacteria bacterium]|nr:bifunctional phosphoglucose/phosphomannose isomerase [Ignavibacteria bacterium]
MSIENRIKILDTKNMFEHLKNFPNQIIESIEIAKSSPSFNNKSNKFFLLGMGGSAIAGDLLQVYFRNSTHNFVEVFVNRNYYLMRYPDRNTNLIVSSYSGNTEETIAAYLSAKNFTNNIIGITSGGRLQEILSYDGFGTILIPGGYQPREALGYSFFTLLIKILNLVSSDKDVEILQNQLHNLYHYLKSKSIEYSTFVNNPALSFAKELYNKIVILYGCEETLFPVAMRIKAQIQENSKNLCFAGQIPETNHNEINSFMFPKDLMNRIKIILLSDPNDHPRNQKRIEVINSLLDNTLDIFVYQSNAEDFLMRMFDIIYFFDWVSYYLAIENEIDPTPIPIVKQLKNRI